MALSVLLSSCVFPVVRTGGAPPNTTEPIFETKFLIMAKTYILHSSSPRIPPEKSVVSPSSRFLSFWSCHFYSKIDGTGKMDLTDRQWQTIQQLIPPVHQGRGIPARPVFVPQKLNNLHANLGLESHRRRSLPTALASMSLPL